MYNCCIVIPIYKNCPNEIEIASLQQCLSVLAHYDIFFVTHKGVNTIVYENVCSKNNVYVRYKYYDSSFFKGLEGYNMLCLDYMFYSAFEEYEYMLIYQLDAWVFRDELEQWCMKGYDYVGAPWPQRIVAPVYNPENILVGNGGFSLRKVTSFVKILKSRKNFYSIRTLYKLTNKKSIVSVMKFLLMVFGWHNKVDDIIRFSRPLPEDVFWCVIMHYSNFKLYLPNVMTAALFCLEFDPHIYYNETKVLPFGTHGFCKGENYKFWNKDIVIK